MHQRAQQLAADLDALDAALRAVAGLDIVGCHGFD